MAATITAALQSLILRVDNPLEDDGVTPRDDLVGIKVWYSTVSGFTPPSTGTLVYDGPGLTYTIAGLTPGQTYYVKYALISEIDPSDYVVSAQLSGTPGVVATGGIADGAVTAAKMSSKRHMIL